LENYLRRIIKELIVTSKGSIRIDKISWPPDGNGQSMQEIYYNFEEGAWLNWKDCLEQTRSIEGGSIFVDTIETHRLKESVSFSIQHSQPFLTVGASGTGKSMLHNRFFKSISTAQYMVIKILFSQQTLPAKIQEAVEGKFERKRKGVLGPTLVGQKAEIFIDDINIPTMDRWGVQSPNELLR
jgi:dynein heavy chain